MHQANTQPTVSVIIPTYNRADFLATSIGSVLNQTFKNLELIVVDDGSTDNTKEIVERISARDSRIKYIWQENSGDYVRPINKGLKYAHGRFIAFLDSDDEWLPTKLEKQVLLLESADDKVGLVGCYVSMVNRQTGQSYVRKPCNIIGGGCNTSDAIDTHDSFIGNSMFLIKREVFDVVGNYDENLEFLADRNFLLAALQKFNLLVVPEILLKYSIHGDNASLIESRSQLEKQIREFQYILNQRKELFGVYPVTRSLQFTAIASLYVRSNNMRQARRFLIKAIQSQPANFKHYGRFLATFLGKKFYRDIGQAVRNLSRSMESKNK